VKSAIDTVVHAIQYTSASLNVEFILHVLQIILIAANIMSGSTCSVPSMNGQDLERASAIAAYCRKSDAAFILLELVVLASMRWGGR